MSLVQKLQSVPVQFSFESLEDKNAYLRDELKKPGVSIYYDEVMSEAAIQQAESVVEQGVLHRAVNEEAIRQAVPHEAVEAIQQAEKEVVQAAVLLVQLNRAVDEEQAEEEVVQEYNPDGTYKHRGYKEKYTPLDKNVGEGSKVQNMFIALHFDKLKRNYAFEAKEDPLLPPNYSTKLPTLFGDGTEKVTVNDKFFRYAISEYKKHQSKRIWLGDERSNCFKKGAHKQWTKADRKSTLINAVELPPQQDISYRPSLGGGGASEMQYRWIAEHVASVKSKSGN
jgi:hypothetical protein